MASLSCSFDGAFDCQLAGRFVAAFVAYIEAPSAPSASVGFVREVRRSSWCHPIRSRTSGASLNAHRMPAASTSFRKRSKSPA